MPLSNSVQETLPFDVDYLRDSDKKNTVEKLNETPENIARCLPELKSLMKNNPRTDEVELTDAILRQFLGQAKYDVTKAFGRVRRFVTTGQEHGGSFRSLPRDWFSTKASVRACGILPRRCPDGCAIVVTRIGKWDTLDFDLVDAERLLTATLLYASSPPMSQVNGIKVIHDVKNSSFRHMAYLTPESIGFICNFILDCIPVRYREIHVVNESLFLKVMWALCKRLVSEKLRKRIFFHSSPKELLNYFPCSVLPTEYGGDLAGYYDEALMAAANEILEKMFQP